jgi:uncharacterized protein (TIGR02266 family)
MTDTDLTYVLISDDHELHASLEKSLFQRAGFVIENLSPAKDTMALITELRPVMVILTLDTDGDQVCRKIKQDPALRSTPVALVANYENEEERERCHEAGCDEILRRPLSNKQILAASYRMLKVVVDRFEFRSVVQVQGQCGSDGDSLRECTILNLSAGGAFIETGKLRPVDSEVIVEFLLPDSEQPVNCSGRVAWLNHPEWSRKPQLPAGYGVQFAGVPPAVRSRIEEFIHSQY